LYGICHLSIVPCRKEPSDRSEMVTQLLFGEHFTILEATEKWSRIRAESDGYESWIDNKQFTPLSALNFIALNSQKLHYTSELVQVLTTEEGEALPLLLGSTLPGYVNGKCGFESMSWKYDGQTCAPSRPTNRNNLIETAHLFLHAPYLWGGRSAFGIDCSGFTQMVYKLNGINIRRDANQQAEEGTLLSFIEEALPGDLAFFDNADGQIIHVGIIMNASRIIHASGKVRIDRFDHHGIYHSESKKYSHNLRMIRKII
jgi:cell wall-associated NlpC family hydrolase